MGWRRVSCFVSPVSMTDFALIYARQEYLTPGAAHTVDRSLALKVFDAVSIIA